MKNGNGGRLVIRKRIFDSGTVLAFSGEITIKTVRKLRDILKDFINNPGDLALDFSGIQAFDTAGFQLILAVRQECARKNINFKVKAGCEDVSDILALYGRTL